VGKFCARWLAPDAASEKREENGAEEARRSRLPQRLRGLEEHAVDRQPVGRLQNVQVGHVFVERDDDRHAVDADVVLAGVALSLRESVGKIITLEDPTVVEQKLRARDLVENDAVVLGHVERPQVGHLSQPCSQPCSAPPA